MYSGRSKRPIYSVPCREESGAEINSESDGICIGGREDTLN